MNGFNQDWYSKFYGKEAQEKFVIIIGFCNGGGNYGIDRHQEGEIKEVYAVVGYYVNKEGIPQYNADYLPTLIHEFNHSFINYLLDMEDNREAMKETGESLLASIILGYEQASIQQLGNRCQRIVGSSCRYLLYVGQWL